MTPKDDNNDRRRSQQMLLVFVTVPFVLAVPPILGWFIGSWLDGKLETTPWMMYLLLVLGFVAGFRELFRLIKKFGG